MAAYSNRTSLGIIALLFAALAFAACGEEPKPQPPSEQPAQTATEGDGSAEGAVQTEVEFVHDEEPVLEMDQDWPVEGEMVYRLATRPATLNPLCRTQRIENKILRYHVNLKLLERHPEELEPIPWLAERMPEISEDGLTITWELRKEARWADGSPLTSADVEATWKLLQAQALRFPTRVARGELGPVKNIRALDEQRFVVELAQPELLAAYAFGLNFDIVPKSKIPEQPSDFAELRSLMGSGPYRVVELDREGCLLERAKDWWGDELSAFKNRWRLKRFRYKVVEDSVSAVEQLKKGLIDFMACDIPVYRALTKDTEKLGIEGARYYLSMFSFMGFNCAKKPFDDARVRRAISMLVPRDRINEQRYGGLARAVSGPFFADGIYTDPGLSAPALSLRKAQALLKEAGFEDRDGDGLLDREGKPLSFVLSRSIAGREQWSGGLVEAIRESLAQIGIRMEIEDLDAKNLWGKAARGDFDAYVEVWPVDAVLPQIDVHALYHSSQIGKGGFNWQRYGNEELDELLDEFRTTRNDVIRIQRGRKIHRILHDEQPMIFLFNNPACVIWNKRIAGVHAHPLGVRQWEFRIAR